MVTVYDLIPELFPDTYLVDPGVRRRYRARRELIRAADRVMTLSRSAADDVADHLGVPDDRLTVVGAACSDAFSPAPDDGGDLARAQALVPGLGRHPVVYNGAVEPRKNMETLVEAFARLPGTARRDRQLVLVCRLEPLERNHYEVLGREAGPGPYRELLLTGQVTDTARCICTGTPSWWCSRPSTRATGCRWPRPWPAGPRWWRRTPPPWWSWWRPKPPSTPTTPRTSRGPSSVDWSTSPTANGSSAGRPGPDRPGPTWPNGPRPPTGPRPSTPTAGWRRPAAWRSRPALALVTPGRRPPPGWPPTHCCLTRALSASVDIDLFIDGDPTEEPGHPRRARLLSGLVPTACRCRPGRV